MKLAIAAGILVAGVIAFAVLIPVLAIGLVVLLSAAAVAWLRGAARRLTSPNGALDGRRNVRVVVRDP